jgi:hypothetical protein
MTRTRNPADEVTRAVARLKAGILALVFGVMVGGGIFVMTIWLVIKDGPDMGAHLQLLGQYFIGYSVSWLGAFIGLAYGLLVGAIMGWSIGTIYNRIVGIRLR